jgi:hypothetical protein
MKRFLIGVAGASLLAVQMQGVAVAAPTPVFDVTCVVGGQTTVIWSHAKVTQATLEWFEAGSALAYATESPPITTHRPRGSIVSGAGTLPGKVPAMVRVSFELTKGVSDPVEVACV